MHLLRRCFLAFLLLVGAPAWAAGDAEWLYRGSDIERDPAWTFGTLPNGVRYAVRRNSLPAGQVSIRLRIDAGSLHEADEERGWAHFVEHMAFRGSKDFADRQARQIWQKLGASFGSDTNASTTPTQTVYQLDLPDADAGDIDTSLDLIADMVDTALFDPATVEAEKKIILAEKGRRPELTARVLEIAQPLFYAGLKIAERDTIGTEPTLRAATAAGLKAFYERWYRPERATVIMVGDADPAAMQAAIARHFGGWQGSGAPPAEPDYGAIAERAERAAALAYPGAPYSASLQWLRPYHKLPNTKAREKIDMGRALGARILNRRLQAKARGQAAYVDAAIGESRETGIADITQLQVTAKNGQWREALEESFAIIADALREPPSEIEITRELQNMQRAAISSVEGETTVRSQQWAQQMVNAIDGNSVVASPRTSLALLQSFARQMKPAFVRQSTRSLFEGSGPRLVLIGPQPVATADAEAALAAAERAAPAARQADRIVGMRDLPPLGRRGREVSRETIADLGVTIARFANGSSLTFKQTPFEKGSVSVQLRFGEGLRGLPDDRSLPIWLSGIVRASGFANFDLDAMERLLTGRNMSINFSVGEDAFVLRGATNRKELGDQLRLLVTKLAYPRWDANLFERFKVSTLESYDLTFASAAARAGREFGGFVRPGDERWAPVEKAEIAAATPADFQAFFEPLLASGPIEAIIVGDVDIETAVAAMEKTVAALPARPATSAPPALLAVEPPPPSRQARTFTHQGDANQAYAMIGWNTLGGTERIRERRALSLAANILQVRLFDQLREAEGASYSPYALSSTSESFPDWGIFYVSSALRPESVDTFFKIARDIVTDLGAKPVAADEFARAQNPVISGIGRRVKTNGYWLTALEGWSKQPALISQVRSYLTDYQGMSAEEVRQAVARYVTDAGDWSMLVLPSRTPATAAPTAPAAAKPGAVPAASRPRS